MISLYKHKPSYCALDLECLYQVLIMMYHRTGFGYKIKLLSIQKIASKLTLTDMFNHGCDINLEHSNPIFSLIIFFAYDDISLNSVSL